jgi:hypothetical protein
MRRIMMLGTVAGRRLAGDGGLLIRSRYAKLLVLGATLTAITVVGLLAFAPSARADVACDENNRFCWEKTASPNPVKVGEPLTFTIRGFCGPESFACQGRAGELTDTLPTGVGFVSASATGWLDPPTCSESEGTVTCAPVNFLKSSVDRTETPFVATIEVIPTQCGTFTNTATSSGLLPPVSETFTVVECVPPSAEQCKQGGYAQLGWENQGQCIRAVKTES